MSPRKSANLDVDSEACPTGSAFAAGTISEIDELKQLGSNWNGYGAAPIDASIIEAARQLVGSFPPDLVVPPQVVPMTRGRLQLEWHRGSRSLELEFESADEIHYLKWDSETGEQEEEIIPVAEHDRAVDLIRWFMAGSAHDQ